MSRVRRWALLAALLAAGTAAAGAAEPGLDVRLEPSRIGVEDAARLIVTVTDAGTGLSPPQLPALDNLEAVSGPNTEQQFNWVNGVSSYALRFVWVVRPKAVGSARVGPLSVTIEGRTLTSPPVEAEVVEGSLRPLPRGRRLPVDPFGELFGRREGPEATVELRRLVSDREVVLGEPVLATVVLDTTATGIERFEWATAPSFPGWWAQPVDLPDSITPELIERDGARYQRYPVHRAVLIPLKSGRLEIPSTAARIGIRGRAMFAPLEAVERATGPTEIEVRPRPPAPAGFAGAVGELTYSVSLSPERVELGSTAQLTIRLEGRGNLPLVEPPPAWPGSPDCEAFPPEEDDRLTVDEQGIRGQRTWRTTLLPRRAGTIRLAAVTATVLDPSSGRYREQVLGPLDLEVTAPPPTPAPTPDTALAAQPTAAAPEVEAPEPASPTAPAGWVGLVLALAAGLALGGMITWLVLRRRGPRIPRRRAGSSPSERARELHAVLERWWLERGEPTGHRDEVETLRRDLEAVRFAPGRADHSDTIQDLEERLRRLVRRP